MEGTAHGSQILQMCVVGNVQDLPVFRLSLSRATISTKLQRTSMWFLSATSHKVRSRYIIWVTRRDWAAKNLFMSVARVGIVSSRERNKPADSQFSTLIPVAIAA